MAGMALLAVWAATSFLAACMALKIMDDGRGGTAARCAVLLVSFVAAMAVEAAVGLLVASSLHLAG